MGEPNNIVKYVFIATEHNVAISLALLFSNLSPSTHRVVNTFLELHEVITSGAKTTSFSGVLAIEFINIAALFASLT